MLQRIQSTGIIPIIRVPGADEALRLTQAVLEGGIDVVEVTMTVPGALQVLERLAVGSGDSLLLGAGTVLDPESARLCILAGARFLVTPNLEPSVIRMAHRYGVPVAAGAMTPTEVARALEEGADLIKLFPSSGLGPSYLKALRAPLPQAPLVPTGGVSLENIGDWFAAGAVAVGVGGELTAGGDPATVTRRAREFRAAVRRARGEA
jgi:2-dehydro-3-deoxyphosphogluconate aldolase / (4S)-4-hydroxy-2-oxoglutarate aldolase